MGEKDKVNTILDDISSDGGFRRRTNCVCAKRAELRVAGEDGKCASASLGVIVLATALHPRYLPAVAAAAVAVAVSGPIDALPNESPLSLSGYQSHTPSGVAVDLIMRDDDYAEVFEEALEYPRKIEGVPAIDNEGVAEDELDLKGGWTICKCLAEPWLPRKSRGSQPIERRRAAMRLSNLANNAPTAKSRPATAAAPPDCKVTAPQTNPPCP